MVLKDKIAVITGTAGGIGRAAALVFAREGARVIGIDILPSDETLALMRKEGYDATAFQADVSDAAQVERVARDCEKLVDCVDVLFNNAGKIVHEAFEGTSPELWADMVGSNLTGSFLCSKYFLPLLKKAEKGAIVHHASIDGFLGNPAIAGYSAAKGGLIPLTHVMAHDLAKYGIRVNCICSGGIEAARNAAVKKPGGTPGKSRVDVTPAGRLGTPEEVASVALFLVSPWASYVNGANIVVDGGRTGITQGTYHGYD